MKHPKYPDDAVESPWGKPEHQTWITQEILSISTKMGGGYFVSGESFSQIPAYWRMHAVLGAAGWGSNWFENETGANGLIITFPELFSKHQLTNAYEYADIHGLIRTASEARNSKKDDG